jgi:hypothetical protein
MYLQARGTTNRIGCWAGGEKEDEAPRHVVLEFDGAGVGELPDADGAAVLAKFPKLKKLTAAAAKKLRDQHEAALSAADGEEE